MSTESIDIDLNLGGEFPSHAPNSEVNRRIGACLVEMGTIFQTVIQRWENDEEFRAWIMRFLSADQKKTSAVTVYYFSGILFSTSGAIPIKDLSDKNIIDLHNSLYEATPFVRLQKTEKPGGGIAYNYTASFPLRNVDDVKYDLIKVAVLSVTNAFLSYDTGTTAT